MTVPTRSRSTRGKTQPGRLARLDAFVSLRERALLTRSDGDYQDALFVDVGFGQTLATTLESLEAFRLAGFRGRVVAVDIDEKRVELARQQHGAEVDVRTGGFELPLREGEHARLVRAMNVLRQYREQEVPDAWERMGRNLVEGGLLLEGTSSKHGSMLSSHLLRKTSGGLRREGLLFSTTFVRGFAPMQMRDYLPRDLRRRVVAGERIATFFDAWTAAWQEARAEGYRAPPLVFAESGRRLASRLAGIDTAPGLLESGYLLWKPPEGVPRAG